MFCSLSTVWTSEGVRVHGTSDEFQHEIAEFGKRQEKNVVVTETEVEGLTQELVIGVMGCRWILKLGQWR